MDERVVKEADEGAVEGGRHTGGAGEAVGVRTTYSDTEESRADDVGRHTRTL